MATSRKNNKPRKTTTRNTTGRSTNSRRNTNNRKNSSDGFIAKEIIQLASFCICVLLMLAVIGFGSVVGAFVKSLLIGTFGILGFIFPILLFAGIIYYYSTEGSILAKFKLAAWIIAVILVDSCISILFSDLQEMQMTGAFSYANEHLLSGGLFGGSIALFMEPALGKIASLLILLVLLIICGVLITEQSFVRGVKDGSQKVATKAKEDAARRRELNALRREERALRHEEEKARREAEIQRLREEQTLRINKKVSGVAYDTKLEPEKPKGDNIREVSTTKSQTKPVMPTAEDTNKSPAPVVSPQTVSEEKSDVTSDVASDLPVGKEAFTITGVHVTESSSDTGFSADIPEDIIDPFGPMDEASLAEEEISGAADFISEPSITMNGITIESDTTVSTSKMTDSLDDSNASEHVITEHAATHTSPDLESFPRKSPKKPETEAVSTEEIEEEMKEQVQPPKEYVFPPIDLFEENKNSGGMTEESLRETANLLQQTLHNFGVNVTITNVSCGPTVTRYELQPEMGVKVSKIVSLTDDIKLNLAAADIRIEAPIPGKAAVGIEVPNKKTTMVTFRELLESEEFKKSDSKISFAVGKDIGGSVIVTDIAKMPHLLIAGATGSGKSVCINTIIMSILYKAKPDEVKLIMVDPKVVELSVYNGIPHLLIPVVTDPKKAAGALNWAVQEMMRRYELFAERNVRDLKGYNAKIETIAQLPEYDENPEARPQKLPQIVIVVDEVADLMMVAPGEVEDSICRLAQLARAAGLHLIIATQRPSVNVITGLIKANMPSRIALSVSSGIDSRTIIDMVGAEKLLGHGDMLFYPQGYNKPARIQGAFINDDEVHKVVEFLTSENEQATYSADVQEKVNAGVTAVGDNSMSGGGSSGPERDQLFVEAGKFIIEKDKASIGMLQRWFKIGFNRAARIMDQLAEAGVVGEEEGTKPRKVLMSQEQFEQFVDEYV